jgi:protein-S-isoprenylcysteine O-methyltransferase Ste14
MDTWDLALRLFLPFYFTVFVLIAGPLGARVFKRKYGFNPLTMTEPDPVMEFGEKVRDVIFGSILLVTLINAVTPAVQAYLGPLQYLEVPVAQGAGVLMLIFSLLFVRVGQLQLKSSWRYGIDRANPPEELITSGLFSFSRNPIYLGMLATSLGLFLVMPNALTLAVACTTFVLLQMRVRIEEDFMTEVYRERYEEYCRRTRRWL